MADLLVKLYELPDLHPYLQALKQKKIVIRKPIGPENYAVIAWIRQYFEAGPILLLYFASFNFCFVSAYVFPYTEAYFAFWFFESYPLMYRPSHLPSLRFRIFSPLRGIIFTPFVLTTKLTPNGIKMRSCKSW